MGILVKKKYVTDSCLSHLELPTFKSHVFLRYINLKKVTQHFFGIENINDNELFAIPKRKQEESVTLKQ